MRVKINSMGVYFLKKVKITVKKVDFFAITFKKMI